MDSLNILDFDDGVHHWQHDGNDTNLSYKLSQFGILKPSEYILSLQAVQFGGTNIQDALLQALETAEKVHKLEEIDSKTQQMVKPVWICLRSNQPTKSYKSLFIA